MNKVLLVDDEKRMLDLLALYLRPHNYDYKKAIDSNEALRFLKEEAFDIVLLDVMMPKMDGWELCKEIRKFSDVPIIMVTAREQREDIVKGLKLGAEDYITKPFNEDALLARMEAILRRTAPNKCVGRNGLRWDESSYELSYKKKAMKLPPRGFIMVGYLIKNPNQVCGREQLSDLIWGFESDTGGRTVD